MDQRSSLEEDDGGDVRLKITELRRISETCSSNAIFEPQSSIEKRESNAESVSSTTSINPAPEKKLTLFALRLSIFEKAATGLGTLGFIWATVVLLGGFAITLDKTDFWFITIILLIEGTRIFSRSHELEWQHQATWSVSDAGSSSFRMLRSSSRAVLRKLKSFFRPVSNITKQSQHQGRQNSNNLSKDGSFDHPTTPTRTWNSCDVPLLPYGQWIFLSRNVSKFLHWLQLLSATACVVLSLIKLIKHNYGNVEKGDSDKRNRQAALSIFYSLALAEGLLFLAEKAYWEWKVTYCKLSKCVNGTIFDGLRMDMVSFSLELLASNSADEKLIGTRILRQFAVSEQFSHDTLQKVGINMSVVECLVEMLNWKDPEEEEMRKSAAEILSKLAGKKQNALRVAGIPGAMESISSLLQTNRSSGAAADEIGEKKLACSREGYDYWTFNHLGLAVLKKLARDHDNCGKIGNTRGLLPKIIDFTHAGEKLLRNENVMPSQIKTVKRSLQLLKMLASTTGLTGKHHSMLRKLSLDILTNLALEEDATERIGGTGGVLKELFNIFFNQEIPKNQNHTLKAIMYEESKLQEVMMGLAAQVFKFMTFEESSIMFNIAGITEEELAYKLVQILGKHINPSAKIPRIRRFTIELAIWMMHNNKRNVRVFMDLGMKQELENVLETTSELESFRVFSGTVGISRHGVTLESLVEIAMAQQQKEWTTGDEIETLF